MTDSDKHCSLLECGICRGRRKFCRTCCFPDFTVAE